ncbi:MAG: hypothetical protein WB608_13890 [Terracidiphilus sp.]
MTPGGDAGGNTRTTDTTVTVDCGRSQSDGDCDYRARPREMRPPTTYWSWAAGRGRDHRGGRDQADAAARRQHRRPHPPAHDLPGDAGQARHGGPAGSEYDVIAVEIGQIAAEPTRAAGKAAGK